MPDARDSAASREHAWVRPRLPLYATHLLREDEAARVESHLESCQECAEVAHELRAGVELREEAPHHIPDATLAHWATARQQLRGFERAMVREHLANCEECTGALMALGQEPLLPLEPELELASDDRAPTDLSGGSDSVFELGAMPDTREGQELKRPRTPVLPVGRGDRARRPAGPSWGRLAIGGWAVMATAASLALLLRPHPSGTSPASLDSLPILTLGRVRSGSEGQDRVALLAGADAVAFVIDYPIAWAGIRGSATITVHEPGGGLVSTSAVDLTFHRSTVQVLRTPGRALVTGQYVVTVTPARTTGAEPIELQFNVVSAP